MHFIACFSEARVLQMTIMALPASWAKKVLDVSSRFCPSSLSHTHTA